MKKTYIFFLILFVSLCAHFSGVVFAEANLGSVSVDFCNIPTYPVGHSHFAVKSGKGNPLCIQLHNDSSEDLDITLGVVDGQLSDGGYKSCSASSTRFARYFQLSGSFFHLPAMSVVVHTGMLNFPVGFSGRVGVCFVYSLLRTVTNSAMFDVLVRKVQFVDGIVAGEFSRGPRIGMQYYKFDTKKKQLSLYLPVFTTGVVDETVVWSGMISNIFGYTRDFVVTGHVVGYSGSVVSAEIDYLPGYLGLYRVEGQVSFLSPTTSFDVSNIPAQLLSEYKIPLVFSLVLIPWKLLLFVIGGIFVLFVVRKLVRR